MNLVEEDEDQPINIEPLSSNKLQEFVSTNNIDSDEEVQITATEPGNNRVTLRQYMNLQKKTVEGLSNIMKLQFEKLRRQGNKMKNRNPEMSVEDIWYHLLKQLPRFLQYKFIVYRATMNKLSEVRTLYEKHRKEREILKKEGKSDHLVTRDFKNTISIYNNE